jgi:hypothetical protein
LHVHADLLGNKDLNDLARTECHAERRPADMRPRYELGFIVNRRLTHALIPQHNFFVYQVVLSAQW